MLFVTKTPWLTKFLNSVPKLIVRYVESATSLFIGLTRLQVQVCYLEKFQTD